MSLVFRQIIVCLWLVLAACVAQVRGAETSFTVKVVAGDAPHVEVRGEVETAIQKWVFASEYAGVTKLDERVDGLEFSTMADERATFRQTAPGRYETVTAANRIAYQVRLSSPRVTSDAAHVSWIDGVRGIVMLNDVLPQNLDGARVSFELPQGWKIYSSSFKTRLTTDVTTDEGREFRGGNRREVEDAVFAVGANLRVVNQASASGNVLCVIDGAWAFEDRDVTRAVKIMVDKHRGVMGSLPKERAALMLMPFVQSAPPQRWSAETRGTNILLMMGRGGSRVAGLAQLENVLAHETFHLWLPNNLNLQGDYAWFYEGFTLYRALRAGVETGALNFQDYLNAVARAVTIYEAAEARRGIKDSLIAASLARWRDADAAALVYSKAMVVACLYDLEVGWQSNGKRGLDDVFCLIAQRHDMGKPPVEANRAVIAVLDETYQSSEFTRRFITAATSDLKVEFARFGLQVVPSGTGIRLIVNPQLSKKQRRLLQRIGMR
ncbi:MAG: hypothetical protein MSG64_08860 [Pyrinomonadaceae bacterium MAG19_C2-C3]|nr:hypothetical protein [Pyrinomonadaceae bacterium MAG19_C2-C3]